MKGYKVFHPDWKCRDYQYKVGEIFEEDGKPVCCKHGFHFCRDLRYCFNYYDFNPENKVAEIEALGDIDITKDKHKFCTNKIIIVREITWEEVLRMVNKGKGCTGFDNIGDYNTGDKNKGHWNTGHLNEGSYNSGEHNYGILNSGDYNVGRCNTGMFNKGYRNSGDYNIGDGNSGIANKGDCNSGSLNTGYCNSGDWNKTSYSNGCFNTEEPKIFMFNKPSNWTLRDWHNSPARRILETISPKNSVQWISCMNMTDYEKEQHPEYAATNGYLKERDDYNNNQLWWESLRKSDKKIILALPNFDKEIFKKITGIRV